MGESGLSTTRQMCTRVYVEGWSLEFAPLVEVPYEVYLVVCSWVELRLRPLVKVTSSQTECLQIVYKKWFMGGIDVLIVPGQSQIQVWHGSGIKSSQ